MRNPHDFHGTLGSLDFEYSDTDKVLHAWSFINPGAGPLLADKQDVKEVIDKIAREHPEETDGGVFDVRTLEWHRRATSKLEPCLYLRLDIVTDAVPLTEMVKKLDHFSTTGYTWHRQKMFEIMSSYWKAHPRAAK